MWRPPPPIEVKLIVGSELGLVITRLRTAPAGFYGSLPTCLPDTTRGRSMRFQKERIKEKKHPAALLKVWLDKIKLKHCRSFITASCLYIKSVPHLDEGVQSLSIHLQELCFNVQHVNFCPGNHYSDKDTICGAEPLKTHRDRHHTDIFPLPVPFASMKYSPSSICTTVLQRTPACSECISLPGNKGVNVSALQDKCEWCIYKRSRDSPTARKTSSRDPDISLLILSSISLPEIFR